MVSKSVGKYVAAIYRQNQILINKKLEEIDIKSGQQDFMYVICNNEGITQKELSERLYIGKATTAKAVKSLIESGYIKREKDTKDKRFYKLYLTDKGREVAPLVKSTFKDIRDICLTDFTEEETKQAINMLKKILDNVYNKAKDIDCD